MPAFQRFVLSALICTPLAACALILWQAALDGLPTFIYWVRTHRDIADYALVWLGLFLILIGTKRRSS